MKYLFFTFLTVVCIGCNQKYTTLQPVLLNFRESNTHKVIHASCKKLPAILGNNKAHFALGIGLLEFRNNAFLTFKGENYFLSFLNMADINDSSVKAAKGFFSTDFFQISDSFLIDYNPKQNYFLVHKINSLLSTEKIDSVKFDNTSRNSKYARSQYFYTNFLYNNDRLLVNYGCRKGKNFIDNTALVIIESATRTYSGKYPERFMTGERIYNPGALFTAINDSVIAMGFTESDEITLFKFNGPEIRRVKLSDDTCFIKFDESKEKNLAYVDKFMQTNEKNVKMFIDQKGNLLFFKVKRKQNREGPNNVICFVMDKNLNPKSKFKLNNEPYPYFIFKYRNGFIAFSKKLDSYDYYEIE